MGIKYHQYGCGNDYGDDHYLTDNWNPDVESFLKMMSGK